MTSSHAGSGGGNGSSLPLVVNNLAEGPLRLAPGAHDDTITVTVTY
jgi:spore coat protein U-like protein